MKPRVRPLPKVRLKVKENPAVIKKNPNTAALAAGIGVIAVGGAVAYYFLSKPKSTTCTCPDGTPCPSGDQSQCTSGTGACSPPCVLPQVCDTTQTPPKCKSIGSLPQLTSFQITGQICSPASGQNIYVCAHVEQCRGWAGCGGSAPGVTLHTNTVNFQAVDQFGNPWTPGNSGFTFTVSFTPPPNGSLSITPSTATIGPDGTFSINVDYMLPTPPSPNCNTGTWTYDFPLGQVTLLYIPPAGVQGNTIQKGLNAYEHVEYHVYQNQWGTC